MVSQLIVFMSNLWRASFVSDASTLSEGDLKPIAICKQRKMDVSLAIFSL